MLPPPKKGYKKYSPPHILALQGAPRAAFLKNFQLCG